MMISCNLMKVMMMMTTMVLAFLVSGLLFSTPTAAFVPASRTFCTTTMATRLAATRKPPAAAPAAPIKKKKKMVLTQEELNAISSRDMTREEMLEYNRQSEKQVQTEFWGMTIFSLVLTIPMLYLVWVGFFADTSQVAGEL